MSTNDIRAHINKNKSFRLCKMEDKNKNRNEGAEDAGVDNGTQ